MLLFRNCSVGVVCVLSRGLKSHKHLSWAKGDDVADTGHEVYPKGAIASEKQRGVRERVCMRVQSKQTVNKYIFLALVSSGSIMCTYSIVITVMDCVRLVLPLSFSFLCYSKAQ